MADRIDRSDRQEAVLDRVGEVELIQEQFQRDPERDTARVRCFSPSRSWISRLPGDRWDRRRSECLGKCRGSVVACLTYLRTSSSGVSSLNDMETDSPSFSRISLRLVVMCVDRAGVGGTRDGHLEREQLGGCGIERRPGGGKRDADARPRSHRSAGRRRRDIRAGRGRRRAAAKAILRPPFRRADEIAQPHRAAPAAEPCARRSRRRARPGSCRRKARRAAAWRTRPPRCWPAIAGGDRSRSLVFAPRFSMTNLLRREDGFTVEPTLFRQARRAPCLVKPPSFWR